MMDFNYIMYGCIELTIEISCCNNPLSSDLKNIWLQNRHSLIEYAKLANIGIRGRVLFSSKRPAAYLTVNLSIEPSFKTDANGEFYRILMPGTYTLKLMLNCDESFYFYVKQFTLTNSISLIELNITFDEDFYEHYYLQKQNNTLTFLNKYPLFCTRNLTSNECAKKSYLDFIVEKVDFYVTRFLIKIPKKTFFLINFACFLFLIVNVLCLLKSFFTK